MFNWYKLLSVVSVHTLTSLSFSSSLSSFSFFFSLETSTPSVFSLDLDLKNKIKNLCMSDLNRRFQLFLEKICVWTETMPLTDFFKYLAEYIHFPENLFISWTYFLQLPEMQNLLGHIDSYALVLFFSFLYGRKLPTSFPETLKTDTLMVPQFISYHLENSCWNKDTQKFLFFALLIPKWSSTLHGKSEYPQRIHYWLRDIRTPPLRKGCLYNLNVTSKLGFDLKPIYHIYYRFYYS